MFIVAIANSKGGCGKTTVATHIAAHFAGRGFRTGLADLDRQQSALGWLRRRPDGLAPVAAIDLDIEDGTLPKGIDRLVVDCPAAMAKATVKTVVQQADAIIVPVLPSAFDEDGTIRFLGQLLKLKPVRKNRREVAFIANRTRPRTRACDRLHEFLGSLDFPVATQLRDTQQYANAVADGLTLFETGGVRAQSHRDEWKPLFDLLERWA